MDLEIMAVVLRDAGKSVWESLPGLPVVIAMTWGYLYAHVKLEDHSIRRNHKKELRRIGAGYSYCKNHYSSV